MDPRHRLQLAQRIHLGLLRELGQGIDLSQMLGSALYARDVLLVCQAYPRSELPYLGEQFRRASAEAGADHAAPDAAAFAAAQPPVLPVLSDGGAARRWLQPSSWFTR